MNKQTGFTLIELIMVIVILGILAATALPKFVNLGSDARTAAVQALEGSMRSANSIIYAKAAVQNVANGGNVIVGAATVISQYGFAQNVTALSSVMDIGPQFNLSGTTVIGYGTTPVATCGVTYTAPATASAVPAYATGTTTC